MKKVTNATFNKLSKEQLIRIIEKVEHVQVLYCPGSKRELVSKVIGYYNKGLVNVKDLM